MNIRFGFLTKLGIAMFLAIIVLRIWFDIPLALSAIPIFIDWVAIPFTLTVTEKIGEYRENLRRNRVYNNLRDSGRRIHWDYKNGKMFEDIDAKEDGEDWQLLDGGNEK